MQGARRSFMCEGGLLIVLVVRYTTLLILRAPMLLRAPTFSGFPGTSTLSPTLAGAHHSGFIFMQNGRGLWRVSYYNYYLDMQDTFASASNSIQMLLY